MSFFNDCAAVAPAYLCLHQDIALYLLPSVLLALVIRVLSARHPFFFLFTLAGTICHELAHFCMGLLTGARPQSFSIIPRRVGNRWELGSVVLGNVRWYNAAPAALAPILIIAIPILVAAWRTEAGLRFQWTDLALAFVLAPQFLSCWPSWADWKIALRSWPYLLLGAAGGWFLL
ncbi:MAG: hypothetical protein V4488_17090 [Pseudomonadota bacterium]